MYRLNDISHVAHNVDADKDRCIVTVRRQIGMGLDRRAEPIVQRAGLLPVAPLTERWFKIHESLINAFLGLPIDGELVSGCLWDFENMMPEGTGRPRWDWFREMFGEPPAPPVANQCTVTFSWLRTTFGVLPDHLTDEMVLMHARVYIWMLLSICLFGDKTGARAHVRWLPYLLRIDDLGRYSWGP
ncbi:hypothetical protein PIB30_006074 [Stylosanthes scabra]|uniref:Aminotransferase-like plant mobile domain-containing protein n=1 Tax=Stylosanthes scabra TaxID=79078 RepID=A0ABU6V374_9FABA|nr:hypothetical protein [Stylosanthes scabra]